MFGGSPLVIGDSLRVTGSVDASLGLSGSLTRLSDGTSYLVAGSNVTITSSSNGQVTIASSGGGGEGSITVKENDGDPEVSDVTTISFDNAIVTDAGSNTVVISGTIGTPEDGSYEDGLFTSFTNKTYTGVAIDKITLRTTFPRHRIKDLARITYRRPHAWVLSKARRYMKPFVYSHPQGAIKWVKL